MWIYVYVKQVHFYAPGSMHSWGRYFFEPGKKSMWSCSCVAHLYFRKYVQQPAVRLQQSKQVVFPKAGCQLLKSILLYKGAPPCGINCARKA